MKSSAVARRLLAGVPDVEVVDFQFGYEDKDRHEKYFVSKWIEGLERVSQIPLNSPDATHVEQVMDRIYAILKEDKNEIFFDVLEANAFYDSQTKKVILFDLNLETLNQNAKS
jgi:hypothetical protein